MTLQQLEYVLALEKTRHFVRAAELSGVTQPTLSAMIQKLEDELDCKIFDRSRNPIEVTEIGLQIIRQAQEIVIQANQLKDTVQLEKELLAGSLNLAIIPTIAPYLLPKFIATFKNAYPEISLKVSEMHTSTIIEKLRLAEIDIAIISTPLENSKIFEVPLYYEKFTAYISPNEPIFNRTELSASDMPLDHLWVLEEGHCLRNQVFNFCNEKPQHITTYEAGSIDTLIKIVDVNGGYTVIPELHIELLNEKQKLNLREIVKPEATREVSVVIRHDFVREGMLNAVAECIKQIIPVHMLDARLKKFAIRL